jgi:hypothetical protein
MKKKMIKITSGGNMQWGFRCVDEIVNSKKRKRCKKGINV